jgi:hypothetical protein
MGEVPMNPEDNTSIAEMLPTEEAPKVQNALKVAESNK